MFTHLITTETDNKHLTTQYKIEFKYQGRVIKTVYINAHDANWSRNVMSEVTQFYKVDAPKFLEGLK